MPGRAMVTGGSGFVGTALLEELIRRNWGVHALVNRRPLGGFADQVRSFPGGVFDKSALDRAMQGCDAVVHLIGIIMENRSRGVTFARMHVDATRNVVEAAKRNNVRRIVHMSALGTRSDAPSEYHRTKFAAEEIVRHSGLEWTIFRPSLIHGPKGEFMQMESNWIHHRAPPFFFLPYFGAGAMGFGGAGKLQPIFVGD